jgi:putative photosynthetic complex assembly protein
MSGAVHNHHEHENLIIPRPVLVFAALAIAVTIVVAAIGGSHTKPPASPVLATRTLSFADMPDGAVEVTDATNGAAVTRLDPGTNGFIRGTLRALSHDGHASHAAPMHPFILTNHADGRLTLDDPTTGNQLDLEAFGSLNRVTFAALLTDRETPKDGK